MKKWIVGILGLLMVIAISTVSFAAEYFPPPRDGSGIIGGRHEEAWGLGIYDRLTFKEIGADPGTPTDDTAWLYGYNVGGVTHPYWQDKDGTVTDLISSSATLETAYGNGETISLDADGDIKLSLAVTARKVEIANTFAGTQAIGLQIDAESANAITDGLAFACTAGTITDAIDASHASIVNAINVGANVIIGTTAQIDFSEFDVAAATGSITIDDDGNVGQVSVEGTVLDINSLTFVGAGEIKTAAGTALTLAADDGATAAEDLIITANNISLTAVGLMTFSPDAALAVAINLEDTDIATALSVGANDIVGTTGLINYTNFDVNADGDVTCVDLTASGAVNVGTFKQDALIPSSGAPHAITLDGAGAGVITIGGTSTGTITLGGGATLVNLPSTVDMTLSGGTIGITDTGTGPTFSVTNNTLTTTNLVTLSATALTSANLVSATAGNVVTGSIYYAQVTDGAGFTGYYFRAYDGGADDFSVKRYGATIIAGNASGTDALTLTNGDILVTAGNIDITTGTLTVGTGNIAIATNGNITVARGGIQSNTIDDDSSYIKRNQTTTTAALFTVEETHTGADYPALVVTQNATGAFDGIDVSYAGSTYSLHDTLTAAAGDGIYFTVPASYTGQLIKSDLLAWLGTSGEGGIIDVVTTAAATQEVGQGIRLNFLGTGTAGTAVTGKALFAHANAGVKAGESLVFLDTLFNSALHIKNDGVSADGIVIEAKDAYTGQGIIGDLGAWLGTASEGFIHITSDAAATVPAGSFVYLRQLGTGQHAAAIAGTLIYLEDDATAPAAGTSYVMNIDATNIEAIHVDTGKVLVDETVTATGGISAGNAADSTYKTDTVELSSANIKALRGTKKELIATPGPDYFIEVISVILIYDYDTAVYTETEDNLVVQYATSGDDITAAIDATGLIDAAADTIMSVFPVHPQAANAATDMVNNAVELFNTGDGEYAGDGAGTMTVKVTYRIHKAGL